MEDILKKIIILAISLFLLISSKQAGEKFNNTGETIEKTDETTSSTIEKPANSGETSGKPIEKVEPSQAGISNGIITFSDEKYTLAYADANKTNSISEYLRQGETTKRWKQMITIIKWKQATAIKEIFPGYYQQIIKPLIIGQPPIYKNKNSKYKEELLAEFLLKDPRGQYLEFNLHRMFTNKHDEVYSLIFAIKIPYSTNAQAMITSIKTNITEHKHIWRKQLIKLKADWAARWRQVWVK